MLRKGTNHHKWGSAVWVPGWGVYIVRFHFVLECSVVWVALVTGFLTSVLWVEQNKVAKRNDNWFPGLHLGALCNIC